MKIHIANGPTISKTSDDSVRKTESSGKNIHWNPSRVLKSAAYLGLASACVSRIQPTQAAFSAPMCPPPSILIGVITAPARYRSGEYAMNLSGDTQRWCVANSRNLGSENLILGTCWGMAGGIAGNYGSIGAIVATVNGASYVDCNYEGKTLWLNHVCQYAICKFPEM